MMSDPQAMVGVRYIGKVARKTDRVGKTKTIWNGPGDVQRVPASVARKLFRMPGSFVPEDAEYKLPEKRSPDAECMIFGRLAMGGRVGELEKRYPEEFARLRDAMAATTDQEKAEPVRRGPGRPRKDATAP